ncbi:MAG TPA: Sec-independent protein translocase subunit TatA [Streptosporangiaceae bacterium]
MKRDDMGFDALQPWHIIVLVVVLVLLFGAKRLPGAAKSLGQSMHIFKRSVQGGYNDEEGQDGTLFSPAASVTAPAAAAVQTAPAPTTQVPAADASQQLADLQRQVADLQKQAAGANGSQAQATQSL